jgi:hypothetical protein
LRHSGSRDQRRNRGGNKKLLHNNSSMMFRSNRQEIHIVPSALHRLSNTLIKTYMHQSGALSSLLIRLTRPRLEHHEDSHHHLSFGAAVVTTATGVIDIV